MKRVARAVVVWGVLSLLAIMAFGQGMTWDSRIVRNGQEALAHTYYVPKKIKTVGDGDGDFTILRLDQEKVYTVHVKDKTYTVITFAEMEQMGKQANSQYAEMQKKMKDMPEEQRKMMEKMLGNRMPGAESDQKVEVVKTGEQQTISGYSCMRYIVKRDGKDEMSIWVTPDIKGFASMKADVMEQTRRMSAMMPGGMKGLVDAMQKIDGFPMETEVGTMFKSTVVKVDMKTVGASEFEVPAGFTKVENKPGPESTK